MKGLVCSVCGYVHLKDNAPERCPVCGVKATAFSAKEDALKTKTDVATVGESEKKHLPAIFSKVMQCCTTGQCNEIMAKVGEIVHPMTPEHYITSITFYIDKEFAGYVHLTPALKPIGAICTDKKDGKISVVSNCNLHGSWYSEL